MQTLISRKLEWVNFNIKVNFNTGNITRDKNGQFFDKRINLSRMSNSSECVLPNKRVKICDVN